MDTIKQIDDNLSLVDVRYLGSGESLEDLKYFELSARIFDKESNSFANEKILDLFKKKIEDLTSQLEKPWNSNLSKPITPTKDYKFKLISPLETPAETINCALCLQKDNKIVKLKSKKVYKVHLITKVRVQ